MDFEGNFIRRGRIPVAGIRGIVETQSERDWSAFSFRQKHYQIHKSTRTIPLLFDKEFDHFGPTECEKFGEFKKALAPIFKSVAKMFDDCGWIIRCLLTRLEPGGTIRPHCDGGFSLSRSHRLHLPVATNKGVKFTVGDETIQMEEGVIWEINNLRRHDVVNGGSEARVHLVMDWACPTTRKELARYMLDHRTPDGKE